jgi:hypothetical protein
MNTTRMADPFAELITELGYERFASVGWKIQNPGETPRLRRTNRMVPHGGDFGAGVSSWLGRRHAARIIGLHLNYIPGAYRPGFQPEQS